MMSMAFGRSVIFVLPSHGHGHPGFAAPVPRRNAARVLPPRAASVGRFRHPRHFASCVLSGARTALRPTASRAPGAGSADGARDEQRHANAERYPVAGDLERSDHHDAETDQGDDEPGQHQSSSRMPALHLGHLLASARGASVSYTMVRPPLTLSVWPVT